ncbi:uncharacterized protein [Diadema antillarum]|uniref:uncharacterized protein n=1 Tax=Diadema antillarum TaxID=105358 RepID=UPI003A8A10A5
MANFISEDYSDISIEDVEDWNDLVLHPQEDEIGVSSPEITGFAGESHGEDARARVASTSASTGSASSPSDEPKTKKKKKSSSTTTSSDKPVRTSTTKAYFVLPPEAREDLQSSRKDIVKGILEGVSSDDQFSGKYGYGGDVRKLASNILSKESTDSFECLGEYIICLLDLVGSLSKTPIGPALQDDTFKKFHEFRMSKESKKHWDSFLAMNEFHPISIVDNILYQHMLEKLLDLIVVRVGGHQRPEQMTKEGEPNDGDHDAQVLRYIAGFVPYALLKRYRRSKQSLAKEYAAILQSWKATEDGKTMAPSFLSYTVAWIEMQNRGGLFCVTDDVFRLFWAMETASKGFLARSNLNAMKNVNVRDTITEKCAKDKHVLQLWNTLTAPCSHKTNMQPLFLTIINYWTKIRIHAFVKASNLVQKTKKTSLKGEKSLRKELVKK